MCVYYWPIGLAVRHVFTLCGKVTYLIAERPVGKVGILSLPLFPSLHLRIFKK